MTIRHIAALLLVPWIMMGSAVFAQEPHALLLVPWIMMGSAVFAQEPQAAELPAEQAARFDATCKSLAEAFLKDDVAAFLTL